MTALKKMTTALSAETCIAFQAKFDKVTESDHGLRDICDSYDELPRNEWLKKVMRYAPPIEKKRCVEILPIVENIISSMCVTAGLSEESLLAMGNMRRLIANGDKDVDSALIWTIIFCFASAVSEAYCGHKIKSIRELETYVPLEKFKEILVLINLKCPISTGVIQFLNK